MLFVRRIRGQQGVKAPYWGFRLALTPPVKLRHSQINHGSN